ncbi:MAG: hypothetical protein QKN94_gp4 [Narnavirus sp.]|uniref:Uncharacterized protein n=1 Tax=H4BulkLitter234 virus TaxID=2847102 RepID=A0A514DAW2_9MONO|nr:MAG: hypothetical protein QKN94_gp4 [Narnavirus sp.]QDH90731.1 MAG: hypothetical protein H4BulkLitter234_000004 [H4BulkLitter234 virus]
MQKVLGKRSTITSLHMPSNSFEKTLVSKQVFPLKMLFLPNLNKRYLNSE